MTFEPGQQVLVRATVISLPDLPERIGVFVELPSGDRAWTLFADIVGPAPATPTEGEPTMFETEVYIKRLEDALAAAEARIAAALALVEYEVDPIEEWDAPNITDFMRELRRALSVEAS
jgi:hypothetical protein